MSLAKGALAALMWSILAVHFAWAQGARPSSPRVAVIAEPQSSHESARLIGELRSLGYDAVATPQVGPGGQDGVAYATRDLGASAAVRITPGARAFEVWVADSRHEAVLRDAVIPRDNTDEERANAVFRTVEVVRASGLPVPDRREAPSQSLPSTPPSASSAKNPTHGSESDRPRSDRASQPNPSGAPKTRFGAGVGYLAIHAAGGMEWSSNLQLSLHVNHGRGLVRVFGTLPFSESTVHEQEGAAHIKATLFGAQATFEPLPRGLFRPYVLLGVAGAYLGMTAQSNPGFIASDQSRMIAVLHAGVGARVELLPNFAAMIGGWVGAAAPNMEFVFVDRAVASFKSPALALEASIAASF